MTRDEAGIRPTEEDAIATALGPVTPTIPTLDGAAEPDRPPWAAPEAELAGPRPVEVGERVGSVDVLRGVALLGILAMNIVAFAWPMAAYSNPLRGGGFEGTDRVIWTFNHLIFEAKMMTLFSMLFGAGLVLMSDRADARGGSLRGVYYRRCLWLVVIGLVHAYLIWSGDILVLYGECGLVLYLFRRRSPRTLILVGVVAVSLLAPVLVGIVQGLNWMERNAAQVAAMEKAGQKPTGFAKRMQEVWIKQVQPEMKPDEARRLKNWNEEMATFRGGYLGMVRHRAKELWVEHTIGFLLGGLWLAGGRMLIGMGLMKLGIFAAERSNRFYAGMVLLGYGIGMPLMIFDASQLIRHRFEIQYLLFQYGILYNLLGSVVVALGHVGVVMLVVRAGVLTWLTRRLAAVGRMALSNYLTHSVVCTSVFYGYGAGLFGTINRTGLAAIVVAIWVAQLVISPIWLRHFWFGPAEWLWRSLTYGRAQPMLRPPATAA